MQRRRSETHGLPMGEDEKLDRTPPEWASVALWARLTRDPAETRRFPDEPAGPDGEDGGGVLSREEYEALRDEWAEAGSPMFGVRLKDVAA